MPVIELHELLPPRGTCFSPISRDLPNENEIVTFQTTSSPNQRLLPQR
jgi:hypothetical protein